MKKAATVIVSVLLWAVILIAALYAFTTMATKDSQNVSSILGYTPMTVQSDSMSPTFEKGDLIFVKKCDTAKLEVGDIVCFHTLIENQYALNTHRIEKIDETEGGARSYTTRGDNNAAADQHIISDGDIVGKYVGHWAKVGKVMDFLSSSVGFLIVIVIPMLIFFIYQVYNLIMINIRLKRAIAVENAQAAEEARLKVRASGGEDGAAESDAEAKLAEAERLRAEAEEMKRKAAEELAKAQAANASAGNSGNGAADGMSDGSADSEK